MAEAKYDVLTIGNAIVDVLAHTEEDFLVREGLVKGSMRLIDGTEADRLYGHMGAATLISGGCAGNTAAGVASYGARAAFIGKVADDELGRFFRHDLRALGIHFPTAPLDDGTPTARSMILITPDGERTMNTNLAACQELTPDDIDRATVEGAAITYLEGYLWDPPKAKDAFRHAIGIAHAAGRKVAITLSDSFCVDRFRDEFIELMRTGALDIVFANRAEVLSLYQTSDFETAVEHARSAMSACRGDAERRRIDRHHPRHARAHSGRACRTDRRSHRRRRPLCGGFPLWAVARLSARGLRPARLARRRRGDLAYRRAAERLAQAARRPGGSCGLSRPTSCQGWPRSPAFCIRSSACHIIGMRRSAMPGMLPTSSPDHGRNGLRRP